MLVLLLDAVPVLYFVAVIDAERSLSMVWEVMLMGCVSYGGKLICSGTAVASSEVPLTRDAKVQIHLRHRHRHQSFLCR